MRGLPPGEAGLERMRGDGRAGSSSGGGGEVFTEGVVYAGRRRRPLGGGGVGMTGGEVGGRVRVCGRRDDS